MADTAEPKKERKVRAGTKRAQLIEMLRVPEGATIAEIVAATGVASEKDEKRGRTCRIGA